MTGDAAAKALRPLSGQNSRGLASAGSDSPEARCEEIFDSVSGPFGTSLRATSRVGRRGSPGGRG